MMFIVNVLLVSGIISTVQSHTQPPNDIYSEYLRRLTSTQGEPPKESTRLPNQNKLQPRQQFRGKPNYYSQAAPKNRDSFYRYHGFQTTPDDIETGSTEHTVRPDQPFRSPKSSPMSRSGPKSNRYTPPMYGESSRHPEIRPGKYGRYPYQRTRPSFMPTGNHDTYHREADDDVHLRTDHPETPGVSPPSNQDPNSTSPPIEEQDHHLTEDRLIPPERQDNNRPISSERQDNNRPISPERQDNNRPIPPELQDNNRPISPERQDKNRPIPPELQDNNRPIPSEQQDNNRPVPPERQNNNRPVTPERQNSNRPFPPELQDNNQVNPNELYSPFSSKQAPDEPYSEEFGRYHPDPDGILPSMENIADSNETQYENSFPANPQIHNTSLIELPTPPEPGNQVLSTLTTTTSTITPGPGELQEEISTTSKPAYFTENLLGKTTTTSYEWPTKQVNTSVSVDVEPIRNEDKDILNPDGKERDPEEFDYDSENNQQENYSEFYDDVYPDSKNFEEEYDQEDYGEHQETSNETVNNTTYDEEWPDYANGVLYMGKNPTNETNNATDSEIDGGVMQGDFNATAIAVTDDEKHPIMILVVVIGVSVILIAFIVIAIVIVNHLRRKIEEPKLLNFMHNNYCNLAETSFTTGFMNRAYEELNNDQSSIARSMENLAAQRIASDSRTKLVGSHPTQMYGNFQNGAAKYGYSYGGSFYPNNGFAAHGYQANTMTPVEVEDDPDLNLTLAAAPIDKCDEVRSVSSESTDDLFVRNDFVNIMAQPVFDNACHREDMLDNVCSNECVNPLYLSSHTLPGLDMDDPLNEVTQCTRDNYTNSFLENGAILATSTPREAPPSGLYRTSSCPDCSAAMDNLSDEVFLRPDQESSKVTNIINTTGLSLSESNLARHLALCDGGKDPSSRVNQSLCSLGSKVVDDRWEMRTGF